MAQKRWDCEDQQTCECCQQWQPPESPRDLRTVHRQLAADRLPPDMGQRSWRARQVQWRPPSVSNNHISCKNELQNCLLHLLVLIRKTLSFVLMQDVACFQSLQSSAGRLGRKTHWHGPSKAEFEAVRNWRKGTASRQASRQFKVMELRQTQRDGGRPQCKS